MAAKTLPTGRFVSSGVLDRDPRWQLVNRIAASEKLRRSQRLCSLLFFTADWALQKPKESLREQEIGAGVFERPADYDTGEDTIVRVHMFQLRKRLKEYFDHEGAGEPIVLEFPRGAYLPEFTTRKVPEIAEAARASPPAAAVSRRRWLGAVALVAVGIGAGWLGRYLEAKTAPSLVDSFWIEMFRNQLPTEMVVADSSLSQYQEMLGRNITLPEYQGREWQQLASPVEDPSRREMANLTMIHRYTSFAETLSAYNVGVIAARNQINVDLVSARELPARDLEMKNLILGGNRRADPWMKFFEDRLKFQYEYDDAHAFGYFHNVKRLPGEEEIYRVQWNRKGYCRVAYLSNLSNNGSVLISEGTDLSSAEAGEAFVTSNQWIARLRNRLSLKRGEKIPHFEVLLAADLAVDSAPRFEIVSVRTTDTK